MTQFNPTGLLDGAAGQAIAQSLQSRMPITPEQQALLAQKQQEQLGNELPNMMQAMANSRQVDSQSATAQQAILDAQTKSKNMQAGLDKLKLMAEQQQGTPDAAQHQLGYAQALMGQEANSGSSLAQAMKDSLERRKGDANQKLKEYYINYANKHGDFNNEAQTTLNAQLAMPDDLKKLQAEVIGADPDTYQKTLDGWTHLAATGQLGKLQPAINKLHDDMEDRFNNPNMASIMTNPKLADKGTAAMIGAAAQWFMQTHPDSGMTREQVLQGLHTIYPKLTESVHATAQTHHVAAQAFAEAASVAQKDRQLEIEQQNATTQENQVNATNKGINEGLSFEQQKELADVKAAAAARATAEALKDHPKVEDANKTFNNKDGKPMYSEHTHKTESRGDSTPPAASNGGVTHPGSDEGKKLKAQGFKFVNGKWE